MRWCVVVIILCGNREIISNIVGAFNLRQEACRYGEEYYSGQGERFEVKPFSTP